MAKFKQLSMTHQARHHDATCVLVSGLVYHTVLPRCGDAPATQYDTPSPKLRYNLRHSVIMLGVPQLEPHTRNTQCYTKAEISAPFAS